MSPRPPLPWGFQGLPSWPSQMRPQGATSCNGIFVVYPKKRLLFTQFSVFRGLLEFPSIPITYPMAGS